MRVRLWTIIVTAALLAVLSGRSILAAQPEIVVADTHSGSVATFSGPESLHGFNFNGVPTLIYSAYMPGDSSLVLYEAQRINGSWTTQRIPGSPVSVNFAGAVAIGSTLYAGATGTAPDAGVTILSQTSGVWSLADHQAAPANSTGYGLAISMGVAGNRPYAVYGGGSPPSANIPMILEQQSNLSWQETPVNLPNNAGPNRFGLGHSGADPQVLVGTQGGFGDFLAQRTNGVWSSTSLPDYRNDFGASLRYDSSGNPELLVATSSSNGTPTSNSILTLQNGTWTPNQINNPTGVAVGSDFQILNGVPTVAYLDRQDGDLHFRQLINGIFTDKILDTNLDASFPDAVSVFAAPDGNIGVAYLSDIGGEPLRYIEVVPEPAIGMAAMTLGLITLSRRRRGEPRSDSI